MRLVIPGETGPFAEAFLQLRPQKVEIAEHTLTVTLHDRMQFVCLLVFLQGGMTRKCENRLQIAIEVFSDPEISGLSLLLRD